MRRTLPFANLRRDSSASAPYAVVAVIILMGAGMSYAYLAHLNASRLRMDGVEPWSDGAIDVLDREEAHFREAVQASMTNAMVRSDWPSSVDLVSRIGLAAEGDLVGWASARYPYQMGGRSVTASAPRLSVSTVYGTVLTGNVLGQQLLQRLPVGIEAVGVTTITVGVDGGAQAHRDVVARVDRAEPLVLAAQLQNILEYTLADEGLVPKLIADALSSGLAADPEWTPLDESLVQAIDGAIGVAERCLFRSDTGPSALYFGPGDQVTGPDLLGPGEAGAITVQMPEGRDLTVNDPRALRPTQYRLVPWIEWRGREVDVRISKLWSAEADGPGGAVIARLDISGRFDHRVEVWAGDTSLGSVVRQIQFRDHLVTWAEDPDFASDGKRRWGKAQVEDWDDLRNTMDVVSPPVRQVSLEIPEEFGPVAEISIDGVHLGMVPPGDLRLDNVAAGPHQLLVRPSSRAQTPVTFLADISVPARGEMSSVPILPMEGEDPEAGYAFWFSIMAALHQAGAGPIAHLEHIAAMTGYGPLPEVVRKDPRGHLEEVAFWVEGLDHHLDFRGGQLDDKGAPDPLTTWQLAKKVVSMTKLTVKLLTKLPKTVMKASEVVIDLSSVEGRAAFVVRVQTAEETMDLVEAAEEADGKVIMIFNTDVGPLVERAGNILSAIAIIGKSLTIGADIVELRDAREEGNGTAIAWAVYDLGVDIAQIVMSAVKFASDLGLMVLSKVTKSVLSVIGSAISVVTAFLDAYRDAGHDFWGAWELLLQPDTFGDALSTAGFLSALASLVTTVIVTAALPMLTGVSVATALTMAVAASTGVGLIVMAAVLAIWAIFHWEDISCWVHGSVKSEDVDTVEKDVSSVLGSTMELMANLNTVDVGSEIAGARLERGVGLALMGLRTTSGDTGLVDALAGAPLYHLDAGSSQGRSARAVVESRHWIITLWREVDDLVDDDHATGQDEDSEGFSDDSGIGKDHDYDTDIRVRDDNGIRRAFDQTGLPQFLGELRPETIEGWTVKMRVEGDLFKEALEDWVMALEAIGSQLSEATSALARSSREMTFSASKVAEAGYDRTHGMIEIRLPDEVESARVLVECPDGAIIVDGEPVVGPQLVHVYNGTALLTVTGRSVVSEILSYTSDDHIVGLDMEERGTASQWSELSFGRSFVEHAVA
jgi:hypothetical protein